MRAIVIHPMDFREEVKLNPFCYHVLAGQTILEHCIENALRCSQAHRVFVLLPSAEKVNMLGSKYGPPPVLKTNRAALGRNVQFKTYDGYMLDGLYDLCIEHGLTDVLRITGLTPLLPSWLMNDVFLNYCRVGVTSGLSTARTYNDGFYLEMLPFWVIAKAYTDSEQRNPYTVQTLADFANFGESSIITNCNSLMLRRESQLSVMEKMLTEIQLGSDIGDVLEFMASG